MAAFILFILTVIWSILITHEVLKLYKISQVQEHELELFLKENSAQNKFLKKLEDRVSDLENKFI